MHKPNLFIVVTVKFNIDVWLLLMQPGWAVVWRTNGQGSPLCYSNVLPLIAFCRGGASAVRSHGLGALLRCDLIVDPVKLLCCLEGASMTQVRMKWYRVKGLTSRWDDGYITETLPLTRRVIPWAAWRPGPQSCTNLPPSYFPHLGSSSVGLGRLLAIWWTDILFSNAFM